MRTAQINRVVMGPESCPLTAGGQRHLPSRPSDEGATGGAAGREGKQTKGMRALKNPGRKRMQACGEDL